MAGTVTSNLIDVNTCEVIGSWVAGIGATGTTLQDTFGLKKQGSFCLAMSVFLATSEVVIPITSIDLTGATIYVWLNFVTTYAMGTLTSGAMRVRIQDGTNWGDWFVGGTDNYGNLEATATGTGGTGVGGWVCYAINTARAFSLKSASAPALTTITSIGVGFSSPSADPTGGNATNNVFWDVIRHDNKLGLNGGLAISAGTVASPATFQDFVDADNLAANAYGVARKSVGAYVLKGPITIGSATAGTATEFNDKSQTVTFDDALVATSGIYGITIKGNTTAATNVTWGNFVSSVASKGISISSPGNVLEKLATATGGIQPGYGSLAVATTTTITRTVGDWQVDGYVVGARITTSGFTTPANNGTFHITATSALTLTVSETLTVETSATTRTVTGVRDIRWDLVCTSAAGVVTPKFSACTFKDMGRGTLISTVEMRSCTVTNFGDITPAGALIDKCTFLDVNTFAPFSGIWALIINATTDVNSKITNSSFTNCNKAIKITAAGTYTFNNLTFSGNTFDIENSIVATQYDFLAGANAVTTSLRSGSFVGVSQSFTGTGATLTSASFALKKTGAPTGNAVVKLYAHSGTFGTSSIPTGAALATSDNINVANLTTSYVTTNIQFSTVAQQYVLVNATNYVITVEYSGGSVGNTLDVGSNVGGHAGNYADLTGSTWTAIAANDATFAVYVNANVIINATSGANPGTFTNTGNGSTTIINSVTITITVLASSGAGILNARVAVYKTSAIAPGSELLLTNTNASGVATTTFNYLVDTAVTIRVRFDSAGSTRYFPYESTGIITSSGLSVIANMVLDTIAS